MKKLVKLIVLVILVLSGYYYVNDASLDSITGQSILIPNEQGAPIEIIFCPSKECETSIIEFIETTQEKIDCAFFDLGLKSIKTALEEKSKSADVRLFVDNHYYDKVEDLKFARHDSSSQLSHNKFCVKDGQHMFTGSMNPTENGAFKNNNNLVFIDSKTLVDNYQTEFNELYSGVYGKGYKTVKTQTKYNSQLIENYFCPEDSCAQEIIEEINAAQSEIYFMTFSFTHTGISQALIDAHTRGVKVQGVFEKRQNSKYNVKPTLDNVGITTRWDNNSNTMHHKVFLIDNTTITGSMNPSKSGNIRNDENVLIIHSSNITQKFKTAYENLP